MISSVTGTPGQELDSGVNLPAESTQTPVKASPSAAPSASVSGNTARTGQIRESAAVPPPPAEDPLGLLAAALEYIEDRHWEVVLGTCAQPGETGWSCSCGNAACTAAGAHPTHRDWHRRISGQPSKAHEWWSAAPAASVLLPTGRTFDVLETSEAAGCLGLARMERAGVGVGPVAVIPSRRMYFFVLPNARVKAQKLLTGLGWSSSRLDLVCRGAGDYIVAPPSRLGALGRAQWVRRPSETNRWLPDAEELLPALAYACGAHR